MLIPFYKLLPKFGGLLHAHRNSSCSSSLATNSGLQVLTVQLYHLWPSSVTDSLTFFHTIFEGFESVIHHLGTFSICFHLTFDFNE